MFGFVRGECEKNFENHWSNPFSTSCKTILLTGNSQLFSHYLLRL